MSRVKTYKYILSFLTFLLLSSLGSLWAAVFTWVGGDGNWTTPANWDVGSNYPGWNANAGTDEAIIDTAATITLDVPVTVTTFTVNTGTLNQGASLTVTGDIIIAGNGRLNTGNNNLSAANITESGAGAVLNASGQTTAGRTVTFNVDMTLVTSGFTAGTATTLTSSGTGNLTSAGNNAGNFEKTTGGTLTLLDALDVNGNLNITAGILAANGNNITLAGDWNACLPNEVIVRIEGTEKKQRSRHHFPLNAENKGLILRIKCGE